MYQFSILTGGPVFGVHYKEAIKLIRQGFFPCNKSINKTELIRSYNKLSSDNAKELFLILIYADSYELFKSLFPPFTFQQFNKNNDPLFREMLQKGEEIFKREIGDPDRFYNKSIFYRGDFSNLETSRRFQDEIEKL